MRKKKIDIPFTNPKCAYHFVASLNAQAQQAKRDLERVYGTVPLKKATTVIALGGDGTLLEALRNIAHYQQKHLTAPIKMVYGMNLGTLGAWMNPYQIDVLPERINQAQPFVFKPLAVQIEKENHQMIDEIAFNEVALSRSSTQVPVFEVSVNESVVAQLKGDTVICATPQGSRAYYSAAGGSIIPVHAPLLGIQSVGTYQPSETFLKPYYFNKLVPNTVSVRLKNISGDKLRPTQLSCDRLLFKRVLSAQVRQNAALSVVVMKQAQKEFF